MKLLLVALLAGSCAFSSAVELVLSRHASRTLFVELQSLRETRQALEREWGQLLLEQATWATHIRVETMARDSLGMTARTPDLVVELQ